MIFKCVSGFFLIGIVSKLSELESARISIDENLKTLVLEKKVFHYKKQWFPFDPVLRRGFHSPSLI
ncbi:hypothetical protein LEP1GSC062_4220 [Leptospira alexanderi serovar Manhao 3 str. L 60]|uniref:Uncharacterized protein n=1 Tax=Leptospira alexanderi serovar Manhao 3 str. L 60 TaxID=1049759 RepID=V6I110_9LEPT|nr:hypothetical protein LEP1GSC062_4220 [Leptospira alexanderi serovar Manhao 3 str. L 60]